MSKLEKTLSKEDLLQEFRKGIAKMQQSCEELNEAMAQCAETAKQSVKVMRLLRNGKPSFDDIDQIPVVHVNVETISDETFIKYESNDKELFDEVVNQIDKKVFIADDPLRPQTMSYIDRH